MALQCLSTAVQGLLVVMLPFGLTCRSWCAALAYTAAHIVAGLSCVRAVTRVLSHVRRDPGRVAQALSLSPPSRSHRASERSPLSEKASTSRRHTATHQPLPQTVPVVNNADPLRCFSVAALLLLHPAASASACVRVSSFFL